MRHGSMNVQAISALNEPWVLAKTVSQCFYIKDPIKPAVWSTGEERGVSSEWTKSMMRRTMTNSTTTLRKKNEASNMYREEEDQHCKMTTLDHGQDGVTTTQ